jgi:hypothetical protein
MGKFVQNLPTRDFPEFHRPVGEPPYEKGPLPIERDAVYRIATFIYSQEALATW